MFIFLALCLSTTLHAQDLQANYSEVQVTAFTEHLQSLNHFSPVTIAGSHGTLGFDLGAGASWLGVKESDQAILNDGLELKGERSAIVSPKAWIIKGFPFALDIGASIGAIDQNIMQYSIYAQYTVFEALSLPAIAIRANHADLAGSSRLHMTTEQVGAAVSWGLNRLALFGAYDVGFSQIKTPLKEEVTAAQADSRTLGVSFQFFPTTLSISAEVVEQTGGLTSYQSKLSLVL